MKTTSPYGKITYSMEITPAILTLTRIIHIARTHRFYKCAMRNDSDSSNWEYYGYSSVDTCILICLFYVQALKLCLHTTYCDHIEKGIHA